MRIRTQTKTFNLDDRDIDLFSEWLDTSLAERGIERKQRTRTRLLMEELLLRSRDRLGEETSVTAVCDRGFSGRPRLRIEIAGEPFNPLVIGDSELGTWESSLSTAIGPTPLYSREAGSNVIRMKLPKTGMNPLIKISIAILLGIVFGFVGNAVISDATLEFVSGILLMPLYRMWSRMLNAISGPIIFLTVVTALLNTRRIEERGGSSIQVIARYFLGSIIAVALALVLTWPMFRLGYVQLEIGREVFLEVLDEVLGIVPSNIFEPFLTSDTAQLLFLAFAFGHILNGLGDRVDLITGLMRQANVVGLKIAGLVSRLVPIFTAILLCLEIWDGNTRLLLDLWKPLVLALAISSAVILGMGLLVSRFVGMTAREFFAKLWEPFRVSIRTASLDQSFAAAQQSCIEDLGIEAGYVKVGLPQGLVLYMPVSAIGTIVFTLFAAQTLGVEGNAAWYLAAVVMAVVVFVATPPVPGANLLAYVVLFKTLGIPDQALLDAMIFDIVFGLFANAANQTMLQMTMTYQAKRLGLLHRRKQLR